MLDTIDGSQHFETAILFANEFSALLQNSVDEVLEIIFTEMST